MSTFDIQAFRELEDTVLDAARQARSMQRGIRRFYKSDGSVLTEADMMVSGTVSRKLSQLFPSSTLICEETEITRGKEGEWIFVLDPIDGTDVYSQGMPSWAVALGILDRERRPVGAIISAPRFGLGQEELLISLCPGGKLMVDGDEYKGFAGKDSVHQVTIGSNDQAKLDFSHFDGKVRTFGSSIIHLISPVVFSSIQGCINQPSYIWDCASSHAVLLAAGMTMVYCDGSPFIYTDQMLYEKKKYRMEVYAGSARAVEEMMRVLPVKA